MLGDIFKRFRSLPATVQILLALLAMGLSVALSPLAAVLALIWLIASVLALVLRALERRPLRRQGVLALTSLLLLVAFAGLSNYLYGFGAPEQTSVPTPQETNIEEETRNEKAEETTVSTAAAEPVRATYYGEELAGSPTASGELYDPDGFTAAHPYLPLGTRLLVSYNGRSTTVTVNDRLPYESGYDLDLSLAAAQEIGLADVGNALIDAEVLET